jgi:hypothetical protein
LHKRILAPVRTSQSCIGESGARSAGLLWVNEVLWMRHSLRVSATGGSLCAASGARFSFETQAVLSIANGGEK